MGCGWFRDEAVIGHYLRILISTPRADIDTAFERQSPKTSPAVTDGTWDLNVLNLLALFKGARREKTL